MPKVTRISDPPEGTDEEGPEALDVKARPDLRVEPPVPWPEVGDGHPGSEAAGQLYFDPRVAARHQVRPRHAGHGARVVNGRRGDAALAQLLLLVEPHHPHHGFGDRRP